MDDLKYLKRTFDLARMARNGGKGPFAALLVRSGTVVFEAESSTVEDGGDLTCHAEMNLLRQASAYFNRRDLLNCTMYCSTEPCPMSAGAAYWCGVGRIVYGLPRELYAEKFGGLSMGCREVFERAPNYEVEVVGPLLLDEALAVHQR